MTPLSSIDTSVLIEYIDESGTFHSQAKAVIENITSGKLTGLITHPIFVELYYVSCRLYEKLSAKGNENGNGDARLKTEMLIEWLFKSPNILVCENTFELAIEAGRIKQKFALALPDSYVIASAKLNRCQAIFKIREEEMRRGDKLDRFKKEKIDLIFLEDYT